MFKCIDCSFISGLDEYCKHITKFHPKNSFVCGQFGCSRQYFGIRSLKNHLKSHCNNIENANLAEIPTNNDFNLESANKESSIHTEHQSDKELPPRNVFTPMDEIEKNYQMFVLSLFSDPSLDRKRAVNITSNVSKIILDLLSNIQLAAQPMVSDDNKSLFSDLLHKAAKAFEGLTTEKSTIAYLRKKKCYKDPIIFTIDESIADTVYHRQVTLATKKSTVARMNITFIFKKFFELPGIFAACKANMDRLETENGSVISNIIQGSSWKNRKHLFGNNIVIPYCLYHDDFEPGNSLGANSGVQALSSFFVHFPTLPAHIATSLENIFPILSCKTSQKKYGFDQILQPTIAELQILEAEGIVLEINNESVHVFFSLCALLGDNKALNELMGITQCFIKNGFCRICSCTVDESKSMIIEDPDKIRTAQSYADDLTKNDFQTTGIREECAFNQLHSFNVVSCPSVDIMHDLFEGVCHFQLTKIILYFIDKNYFTLDDLNNRKSLYDYGVYEIDNKSVDIKLAHLKNNKLKMSASQSLCFSQHFSLIIGDMIPQKNEVWEFYKILLQLLDLIVQNSISLIEIETMNELVKQNHSEYMRLFNCNLKPKHHFMIHYANLIRQIGPLKNVYVMKHEMYHRELKRYIHQTYNRRNLPKSVLIKESFKFATRLVEGRGYRESPFQKGHRQIKETKPDNKSFFLAELRLILTEEEFRKLKFVKEIYFNNILYNGNSVIAIKNHGQQLQFIKVIQIIKISDCNYKISGKTMEIDRFDSHLMCYIIKRTTDNFVIMKFEELKYFPQNIHKLATGEIGIRSPAKL